MLICELFEDNRIGTAIWKNTIPEKYKKYPIIGQGATSVVLDMLDGNVMMLTRDSIKKDWLVHGLKIASWPETIDIRHPKSRALSEMRVYVLIMPKLFALTANNKTIIKKAITEYNQLITRDRGQEYIVKYLEKYPTGLFAELFDFLSSYYPEQYSEDFLIRNFMQTENGNIVLIDPVVDAELASVLRSLKMPRY